MKKLLAPIVAALLCVGLLSTQTGCVTSKVAQVQPNGTTNFVTVVNEGNLAIDALVAQGAVSLAVNTLLIETKYDAHVIASLKNAKTALDGIIAGANQQTTAQVLALLKADSNPQLASSVTSLVQTLSGIEQNLLAKYGQSVAGEITIALLKSVDAGLTIGLAQVTATTNAPATKVFYRPTIRDVDAEYPVIVPTVLRFD